MIFLQYVSKLVHKFLNIQDTQINTCFLEASLLGTLKNMYRKALEMGICVHKGPILGNMGLCSYPRAFKRRVRFLFIRRNFIAEFKRHVKEGCGIGHLSSSGPPLGNLAGFIYWNFCEADGGGLWRWSISY